MNATITNQCAAPTTLHLSIRVWPSVSASMVPVRVGDRSERLGVGLAEPDHRGHPGHRPHHQDHGHDA